MRVSQDADNRLGGLKRNQSTLDNLILALMPELLAANQSVVENGTKHAANLTAEARQRQRSVTVTIVTVINVFCWSPSHRRAK